MRIEARFLLVLLIPALVACQGVQGTVPGEHWEFAFSAADKTFGATDVRKVGEELARRLDLSVPDTGRGAVSFRLPNASDPQGSFIAVKVSIDRARSVVDLEVRSFGQKADPAMIERETAENFRAVLRELFPTAKEVPLTLVRGLGPF